MSKIPWTEKTWNPVTGCTPISAGCLNCYAKKMHARLRDNFKVEKYNHDFNEVRFHPECLKLPSACKRASMVFVNSMSDLFHEDVTNQQICDVLSVCCAHKNVKFQILTKRAERMREFFEWHHELQPQHDWRHSENIWFGVTTENQITASNRIQHLLHSPVYIRFLSVEPMLEELSIFTYLEQLDWLVIGAESKGAYPGRECKIEWVRDLVRQAQEANIPVFIKQLHIDGKLIKDVNQFPEDLRLQDYPEGVKCE